MNTITLPKTEHVLLNIAKPHVLLVTINHAKQMNSLPVDACWEMDKVWRFLDGTPDLRAAVITGAGEKAFSSGMDLKERSSLQQYGPEHIRRHYDYPSNGFGGFTRRVGLKPVIAAVNGFAYGGGFELALNSDIVLAASHASFRLPDVMRGTAAMAGAFPRLVKTLGMQRASLLALTGYEVSAREACDWGLVAKVVQADKLVEEALTMGELIASMSPDSVIVSRQGLREAWDDASVDRATQKTAERWSGWLMNGDNAREGMVAFAEKRQPQWKGSRL